MLLPPPPVFSGRRCALFSVFRKAARDVPLLLFTWLLAHCTCTWALMIRRRVMQSRIEPQRCTGPLSATKPMGRWSLRLREQPLAGT